MKGDIWIARSPKTRYLNKARPVVVLQSADTEEFDSTVLALVTSQPKHEGPARVRIEPDARNGLTKTSWVMADKIVSLPKNELYKFVGSLSAVDMRRVDSAVARILGIGHSCPSEDRVLNEPILPENPHREDDEPSL